MPALSLLSTHAAQWNKDLMTEFQAALEKDPAAGLLSLFSDTYQRAHRNAQYLQQPMSFAEKINFQTLKELHAYFKTEPEVNLLSVFPKNYSTDIKVVSPTKNDTPEIFNGPEFLTRLDLVQHARIIFPLSAETTGLLAEYSATADSSNNEQSLIASLKKILCNSPKLWEGYARGVVVKCNQKIVAKVTTRHRDYTEYTSMEYLAKNAPDIPAPRPHGFIEFGPFRLVFMSYIPDMTLTQAWPQLSHEDKLSIRSQLDDIFRRLRILPRDKSIKMLGGFCGEGVKELRVNECSTFKGITSTEEFSDLQFSTRHHGSKTYVKLIRSFLDYDKSLMLQEPVFTHGDVRTDNIMVKKESTGYVVTGIID